MKDTHAAKIEEARRLCDLGFYNKAIRWYEQAAEERIDIWLAIEISGTFLRQGNVKRALEKIHYINEVLSDSIEDESALGLARVLGAFAAAITSGQFTPSLEICGRIYDQLLRDRPPEKFGKRLVALQICSAYLKSIATIWGVQSNVPGPSQEDWNALFNQLVKEGRYAEALHAAKVHATFAPAVQKTTLVETLLNIDSVSDLVRAQAHDEYADLLGDGLQADQSAAQFKLAEELYRKVGHATGPLLIEIRRLAGLIGKKPAGHIVTKLFRIKVELEDLGDWDGSLKAVQALYEVALQQFDDELKLKVDEELHKLRDIRGSSLEWCSLQIVVLARWSLSRPNSGTLLGSYEALYRTLSTMEAPIPRQVVAASLSDLYQRLGDPAKAGEWASKEPDAQPAHRKFMLGKDDFYNQVSSPTYVSPPSLELEELRAELARTVVFISANEVPLHERHLSVMKICHMASRYIFKARLLGFERSIALAQTCLEALPGQLHHLPMAHLRQWEGFIIQIRAEILMLEAFQGDILNTDLLNAAIVLQKEAHSIFEKLGLVFDASFALHRIGILYQTVWYSERLSGGSQSFEKAVRYYEASNEGFTKAAMAPLGTRKNTVQALARLWFEGVEHQITIYRPRILLKFTARFLERTGLLRLIWLPKSLRTFKWPRVLTSIGFRKMSPLEEMIKYLDQGEALADEERNDLSVLNTKQAIIAKQALRKTDDSVIFYDLAIRINMLVDDVDGVWHWLQKAKARSLSDLLGLGIHIPEDLKAHIDADPKAQILLEKETALLEKIKQDKTDRQFILRKELEALRKSMHKVECLDELLNLREGQSVSQTRLKELRRVQGDAGGGRLTFLADYFIVNGNVLMVVMSDVLDGLAYFDLDTTVTQVADWRERHMEGDPLSTTDIGPLQELAKLVEPLVQLSNADDLLVLCASGILHSIPLHAATVSADSEKPLIERNPIVYTSSMTIFGQCISRAASAVKAEEARPATFCAVYEQPGKYGWERERESVYATSRKLASMFDGASTLTSSDVTRAGFEKACQSHVLSFYGHHNFEAQNVMDQGLELVSVEAPINESSGSASHTGGEATDQPILKPDVFTVSDIFSTAIHASHITLIACASASQNVQQGDEPLGTVTALLCAGASSVLGTMWAIESGSGRLFSEMFHSRLATAAADGRVIDVATALQQTIKKMRRNDNTEEPFHWASFVLHGSWFYRNNAIT